MQRQTRTRLDLAQPAAGNVKLSLKICSGGTYGVARRYQHGARQVDFFRIVAEREKSGNGGDNCYGKPGEDYQGQRTYKNDLTVRLLLLVFEGFRTKQRQRLDAIVMSSRVESLAGPLHVLLSPQQSQRSNVTTR